MRLGWSVGVALLVHAAVLLFGGVFFMDRDEDGPSLQAVDLLSDLEAEEDEPEEERAEAEQTEELEVETEPPPDGAEILRELDAPSVHDAPALDAASLSAMEAALFGQGGGGDFAEALTFASGGRIGGTGQAGLAEADIEEAFSLAEIDQKPRAVYQEAPVYPPAMRGKKVEGQVTVIFVVDSAGKVKSPRVESSSHTAFESPALNAVKKWKFEPGVRAGERVATRMRVPIRFSRD